MPSDRIRSAVDALPLERGMRVIEIGCGPGAAARLVAERIGDGHVLALDRSATAVAQVRRFAATEISAGRISVRQVAVEDFVLVPGEQPYDLAFALRVGALDGRHRALEALALDRVRHALVPSGRLFVDGRRVDLGGPALERHP